MGPVMIRMAYMPLYIEKNLDVPPVHGRTDEKWKEVQYSALTESKIFKQTVAHFREGGGQLVTSVVLERNGLPVMPTNRVIPVIQVTKLRRKKWLSVNQEEHSSPLATSPLLPVPAPTAGLTVTIIFIVISCLPCPMIEILTAFVSSY